MQALPPANVSRPSRLSAWFDGLRYRPFLWLAPAIVTGCVLGAQFAAWMRAVAPHATRDGLFLLWPLLPVPLVAFLAWRRREQRAFFSRLAASVAIILFFTSVTARRLLPPRGDVSELARAATLKPNTRVPVALQGWVADYPRRGDFGIEFPFECARAAVTSDAEYSGALPPRGGRVWLRVPLDADVGIGDALAVQAELAVLPAAGNPGERELRSRYLLKSCWCVGRVKAKENIELRRRADRYPPAQTVAAARRRILQHYEAAFTGTQRAYPITTAQLLTAMVFGEGGLNEPLPRQTRDAFRAAGISHLLVASGSQIALCVALLLGGAHLLGLRRWWLVLLIMPVLIFYALVAGGAASIWRAAIAGICLTAAIVTGRETDGLTLWSLALGVLLLLNPAGIFDLSLQLSFAAAWGLLALAPFLRAVLARRFGRNALTATVALTLGAQLATAPLSLFHFGRVSVISPGVNFLGVPLAGVLVTTGLAGAFLPFLNGLNYALTTAFASVASTAARLPGAQLETPPVKLQWTLFCYTLLLIAAALPAETSWRENLNFLRAEAARWWMQRRERGGWRRPQTWIVLAVVLLTAWAGWRTYGYFHKPSLLIAALDVGQGESLVVRAPSGRTVLIDGGTVSAPDRGDVGRSVIAPYLASLGVQKIDALIITHSDADHVNGLPFVLREVPVGLVIDGAWRGNRSAHAPGENAGEADYFALREQLRTRRIPVHAATPGQRLNLGDGVVLRVLAPVEPFLNGANNNAAVLRLEYGRVSALFTGDIEQAAEERLVRRGLITPCTILKVAHHGSKTSTSPLWLKAARPRAAVISVGRYNAFGHPAAQTLQRLAAAHVPVFRTDRQGAVEFRCDRSTCRVQAYK